MKLTKLTATRTAQARLVTAAFDDGSSAQWSFPLTAADPAIAREVKALVQARLDAPAGPVPDPALQAELDR